MRKGILISSIFFLVILAGLGFYFREWIMLETLEAILNQNTKELFAGTLQLQKIDWERSFGIHLHRLEGKLQTPDGPVTLRVESIQSRGHLLKFFSQEGLVLDFTGARPELSRRQGLEGHVRIRTGRDGFFELRAQVQKADLEDFVWINPKNFKGSKGEVRGELALRQDRNGPVRIRGKLRVEEPGGKLPAHFFDLITPYLPLSLVEEKVKQIRASGGLVGFRVARLEIEIADPQAMKIFLHLAVPDYNLDLHLKMDIRFRD